MEARQVVTNLSGILGQIRRLGRCAIDERLPVAKIIMQRNDAYKLLRQGILVHMSVNHEQQAWEKAARKAQGLPTYTNGKEDKAELSSRNWENAATQSSRDYYKTAEERDAWQADALRLREALTFYASHYDDDETTHERTVRTREAIAAHDKLIEALRDEDLLKEKT